MSLKIGEFSISMVAVFDNKDIIQSIQSQAFLEGEQLMKLQKDDPSAFKESDLKRKADMGIIQQSFQDSRIPSSYDKGGATYNKSKFDNLLDEEIEIDLPRAPKVSRPIKDEHKENLNLPQ